MRAARGVQLQAEIVDNDTEPTLNAGQYYVTPVVRYHLFDRRSYEAAPSTPPGHRGPGARP